MSNVIDNHTEPPRDEAARSLTRQEFCLVENMSLSTYHKLKRAGLGPDEVKFPGMAFTRITPEARREWHDSIEQYRKSQAAELEKQRRSALASHAGKSAAKSPLHVSKKTKATAKTASPRRAKAEA